MNLLVTGGSGFIGSNVVRHVLPQPEVARLVVLDCLTHAGHPANLEGVRQDPRFVFEKMDPRDQAEVRRVVRDHAITHVVHLATESTTTAAWTSSSRARTPTAFSSRSSRGISRPLATFPPRRPPAGARNCMTRV